MVPGLDPPEVKPPPFDLRERSGIGVRDRTNQIENPARVGVPIDAPVFRLAPSIIGGLRLVLRPARGAPLLDGVDAAFEDFTRRGGDPDEDVLRDVPLVVGLVRALRSASESA